VYWLVTVFGLALLALGTAAAFVAIWAAVNEVRRPLQGDASTRGFDPVEAVKALSAAPLWLALIAVGAGLVMLGALFDGYRFADGGITQSPPVVAASGG